MSRFLSFFLRDVSPINPKKTIEIINSRMYEIKIINSRNELIRFQNYQNRGALRFRVRCVCLGVLGIYPRSSGFPFAEIIRGGSVCNHVCWPRPAVGGNTICILPLISKYTDKHVENTRRSRVFFNQFVCIS